MSGKKGSKFSEQMQATLFWEWGIAQGACAMARRNIEDQLNELDKELDKLTSDIPPRFKIRQEIDKVRAILRHHQQNLKEPLNHLYDLLEGVFDQRFSDTGVISNVKRLKEAEHEADL